VLVVEDGPRAGAVLEPLMRPEAVAERHVARPLAPQVGQQVGDQGLVKGRARVAVVRVAACGPAQAFLFELGDAPGRPGQGSIAEQAPRQGLND